MFLKENIMLAIAGLKANKMRSVLTMLGIIIGISSVISIVSIGSALSSSVLGLMSDMGSANIYCGVYKSQDNDYVPDESDYFSIEDIELIKDEFGDEIEDIGIDVGIQGGIVRNDSHKYANIDLYGVNDGYENVKNVNLKSGRFISKKDVKGNKKTAVVSKRLVEKLFGNKVNPIGQEIKCYLNDDSMNVYYIVGVYEYKANIFRDGMGSSEEDMPTEMYIPATTYNENLENRNYRTFIVKPSLNTDSNNLVEALKKYLEKRYMNNKNIETYTYNAQDDMQGFKKVLSIISLVISIIAAISLLVGGIGVMNIMLVSVTERTREIGTRKALGAKSAHIKMQFIIEAVIICAVGGVIGIIFGISSGVIACILLKVPISISIKTIMISLTFSMAIGVFFGYYPAKKAAKLDPIEALRYE